MPDYHVTVQFDLTPDAPRRHGRGRRSSQTKVMTVPAPNLEAAAHGVAVLAAEQGENPRIVAVEEASGWNSDEITDDQITKALTQDCEENLRLYVEDYEGTQPAYYHGDFHYLAQQVQLALNDSGMVPGLELSLLYAEGGGVEYSMVEVRDEARGQYRSVGSELKHLTTDRHASGWDQVIAIARALLEYAEDLI